MSRAGLTSCRFPAMAAGPGHPASSGSPRILIPTSTGKHIIVVEDIVDTGLTLKHLRQLLGTRNPASIALCTAFDKPDRRKVDIEVEYIGIQIPDEFIVGYGLDFDGKYRNLPDVSILGRRQPRRRKMSNPKKPLSGMSFYVVLLAIIIVAVLFHVPHDPARPITLSELIAKIDSGAVISEVIVTGYTIEVTEKTRHLA